MFFYRKEVVTIKLPNGFGSVYKLSGKRRRPYAVSYTVGWELNENNEKLKQRRVMIGYYATKQEALTALAEYNQNPYDIKTDSITFAEVYDKWSAQYFETIVPSAVRTVKSAYAYYKPIHNMRFKDIRVNHLEGCIKDATVGDATKGRMKSLINLMYRFAIKYEITDKDYSAMFTYKRGRKAPSVVPFSAEEIKLCWDNKDFPFMDMILIELYTGWRPQELAILKIDDIDFDNKTMKGGLKTDAGKNRIIPIHPKIYDLVCDNYKKALLLGSEYLFNDKDGQQGTYLTYDKYRGRWDKIKKAFPELAHHHLHETRHTFITQAKRCGMNEYVLKLIVGHGIEDITEKVYTHRTIYDLQKEMEKLDF